MTDHGVLPGDRVEVHHHGQWLPFLVTHIAEDGGLDGVAFSGRYPAHNWSRPVEDVRNAKRADDGAPEPAQRTWRPAPGPNLNEIVEAAVERAGSPSGGISAEDVDARIAVHRRPLLRAALEDLEAKIDARIVAAIAAIPPADVMPLADVRPPKKAPAKKARAKGGS